MKLNEVKKEIILVCGNLCSGKGHFCQSQYPDYEVISISSIVKQLSGFKTREFLGTTKHLDEEIARVLVVNILYSSNPKIIIDGIRQLSIIKELLKVFGHQIKDIIWLDVPEQELRKRFAARKSEKDIGMNFDQSLKSDRDLGIGDVEDFIRKHHKVVMY